MLPYAVHGANLKSVFIFPEYSLHGDLLPFLAGALLVQLAK